MASTFSTGRPSRRRRRRNTAGVGQHRGSQEPRCRFVAHKRPPVTAGDGDEARRAEWRPCFLFIRVASTISSSHLHSAINVRLVNTSSAAHKVLVESGDGHQLRARNRTGTEAVGRTVREGFPCDHPERWSLCELLWCEAAMPSFANAARCGTPSPWCC